jgi:hypothetical protein
MFRKAWTSNTKLWHSIMLENYRVNVHTGQQLCVVKKSSALTFFHMHAKVKHDWWSDLHRLWTHGMGCGHILLLPDIVLACHVWYMVHKRQPFETSLGSRILQHKQQHLSVADTSTKVWFNGTLCFAKCEFTNCINTVKHTASLDIVKLAYSFYLLCWLLCIWHYLLIPHTYHKTHVSATCKELSSFMEIQNRWVL